MNRYRPGKGGRVRPRPELCLQCWRFEGTIKTDHHSNEAFPHCGAHGLCAYELNIKFTGLVSGGTKGLWLSKTSPEDRKLVNSGWAVDALSHVVLFPDGHARHASMGGEPNTVQLDVIRRTIARMPDGSEIVAAKDADYAGRQAAEVVYKALQTILRAGPYFRKQEPPGFRDWKDKRRASKTPFLVGARTMEAQPA